MGEEEWGLIAVWQKDSTYYISIPHDNMFASCRNPTTGPMWEYTKNILIMLGRVIEMSDRSWCRHNVAFVAHAAFIGVAGFY